MLQRCLAGQYVRNLFARGRGDCALGVARAQVDAPQFVMGARFGEVALAGVHEGQAHFLGLGEFCQVAPED